MARKATDPRPTAEFYALCAAELRRMKLPCSGYSLALADKPERKHGRNRNGKHRSHRCSRTSAGNGKKGN